MDVSVEALGLGVIDPQIGETVEERVECDAGFQAGEVHPEAEMRAGTERRVLLGVPEDVEWLRVVRSRSRRLPLER